LYNKAFIDVTYFIVNIERIANYLPEISGSWFRASAITTMNIKPTNAQ
jgi:hypothetical protein